MTSEKIQHLNDVIQTFARQYQKQSEAMISHPVTALINPTQAHILMLLLASPQPLANNQLALMMKLTRPAITKAIKELLKANYLKAQPAQHDRRCLEYQLTAAGYRIARQHQAGHEARLMQLATLSKQYTPHELAKIEQFMQTMTYQLTHGDRPDVKGT